MDRETAPMVQVVPIAEEHIEGFHRCLDTVARERQYLGRIQAPPLAVMQEFVQANIAQDIA